jgi:hypothetical protein
VPLKISPSIAKSNRGVELIALRFLCLPTIDKCQSQSQKGTSQNRRAHIPCQLRPVLPRLFSPLRLLWNRTETDEPDRYETSTDRKKRASDQPQHLESPIPCGATMRFQDLEAHAPRQVVPGCPLHPRHTSTDPSVNNVFAGPESGVPHTKRACMTHPPSRSISMHTAQ